MGGFRPASLCAAACPEALAAPFLADTLVLAGVPFRRAHHLVGQAAAKPAGPAPAAAVHTTLAETGEEAGAKAIAALLPLTRQSLLEATTTESGPGPAQAYASILTLRKCIGQE